MAQVLVRVEDAQGQRHTALFDAATRRDVMGLAQQQGLRVLGFAEPPATKIATARPGFVSEAQAADVAPGVAGAFVPQRGRETPGGVSPETMSMIGQAALPAGAALLAPETGGGSLALLGLLGGLGGAAAARRGLPTAGDVANVGAGELAGGLTRLGARGARALGIPQALGRGARALGSGVSGIANRLGIPLTAAQRFPETGAGTLTRRGLAPVPQAFEESQAAGVSQAALATARTGGVQLARDPSQMAFRTLRSFQRLAGRLKGPARESLLRDWKTVGIDVGKTTAPQLVKIIREEPLRYTQALKLAQTAAGQIIPDHAEKATATLWASDLINRAAKPTLRRGLGVHAIPGSGHFDIDGQVMREAWRGLDPAQRLGFGASRAKAWEELASVLDRMAPAQRSRLSLASFRAALHRSPGLAVGLGALSAEEAHSVYSGGGLHVPTAGQLGTAAAVGLSVAGTRKLLGKLLASEAGIRWFAAGLDMQARGMPETFATEALSRLAGRLLVQQGAGPGPLTPATAAQ